MLDLGPVGGGQLQSAAILTMTKFSWRGSAAMEKGHAAGMHITGKFAQSLPLFSILADIIGLLGTVKIGENFLPFLQSDASPNAGYIRFGDNTGWKLHFGRSRENSLLLSGGPLNTGTTGVLMTIQDNGNVGIGTKEPTEKLDVVGNIVATGDIRLRMPIAPKISTFANLSRLNPAQSWCLGEEGKLEQSQKAYDKRVTGVVSGAGHYKPGIVLDKQESSHTRNPLRCSAKSSAKWMRGTELRDRRSADDLPHAGACDESG